MSNEQNTAPAQSDQSISKIDAALAASAARRAAKTSGAAPAQSNGEASPAATETKKRVVKTPEQRLQEAKEREDNRAANKAKREKERDERRAAKPAASPAHMKKVAKAAERLPALSDDAKSFFEEAKTSLNAADLIALAAHLQIHCRASATEASSARKLKEGETVKIVSTDVPQYAKFIGKTGVVEKAQRIRCYVKVPGVDKAVYLHISDVEPFAAPTPAEEISPETGHEAHAEAAQAA